MATYKFDGAVNLIGPNSGVRFASPTVQVTTTSGQRMTGAAAAALGLGAASTGNVVVGLCYQAAGTTNTPLWFAGAAFVSTQMTTTRMVYPAAGTVVPGVGTWNVGYCVNNLTSVSVSAIDYVNGWVQVTN